MKTSWLTQLDARVPRYTSYPTAPHFHGGVDGAVVASWLGACDIAKPLSLYVHIPFCRALCWYCGCNTVIVKTAQPVVDFQTVLHQEINRIADLLPGRARVAHLHFGGGSPNILSATAFADVMAVLRARFDFCADAEIAIEIDPRGLDEARVAAYAAAGINRASIGVQDFDADVQKAIHRVQPFEVVKTAVERLRAAGITAINFDLIYGLPLQTLASIEATVEGTLALKADRVALFGYAHVPWMKSQQKGLERYGLPDLTTRAALADAARSALEAAYVPVGIDHFARPDDALAKAAATGRLFRNFQGYTTDDAATLIAIGPSGISAFPQGYAQNEAELVPWMNTITQGGLAVQRGLAVSAEDVLRRDIIERLMCDLAVDLNERAARHGVSPEMFLPVFDRLAPFVADGMVEVDGWRIALAPDARLAVRSIASLFDAYLDGGGARHAAAV